MANVGHKAFEKTKNRRQSDAKQSRGKLRTLPRKHKGNRVK